MTALRIVLALDLGVTGAGVIHHDGAPAEFFDMPCLNDGPAGRRSINAPLLAESRFQVTRERGFRRSRGPETGRGSCRRFRLWPRQGSRRGDSGRSRNSGYLAHARRPGNGSSAFRLARTARRTPPVRRRFAAGPTRRLGSRA